MTKVIGVRFKNNGRIYYFDPLDFEIAVGDGVIVETARGTEFGDVAQAMTEVEDDQVVQPLKPVIRVATETDKRMREENAAKEKEAFEACAKKIEQHKLDMKLVDVEYTFNGSKVIFYFTADERVDFRELVKDLASHFKTRIELRQIGVRDEAKMLGGLGPCGRPVCCKAFLDDFRPVSIKMAKEQNLSLSPTKISGLCGRLMCCLQYEQSCYEEMKKLMPKTGKEIQTPDGVGVALENNAVTEKTKVRLLLPDGTYDIRYYHYSELAKIGEPPPKAREKEPVEMPVPALAEYVQPELPEGAELPSERKPNRRRRSRGGQKKDGAQAVKETPAQDSPAAENSADGGAPDSAKKPNRRRRRKPANKPAEGGEQKQAPKPQGEQKPQGEGNSAAHKRRRHRGGQNRRPKPDTAPKTE